MLADAIRSEAYRFSKNRTAVLWSTMFVPVLMLVITGVSQYFIKSKMGELKGANLPPELLQMGPLSLGHELVDLAGDLQHFSAASFRGDVGGDGLDRDAIALGDFIGGFQQRVSAACVDDQVDALGGKRLGAATAQPF